MIQSVRSGLFLPREYVIGENPVTFESLWSKVLVDEMQRASAWGTVNGEPVVGRITKVG